MLPGSDEEQERLMVRRALLPGLLILAVAVLSACQVRPLYAPASTGQVNPRDHLAAIDIEPVRGRTGQMLRNELEFLLTAGQPAPPAYRLALRIRERTAGSIIHQVSGEPTNRTLSLQVDYQLTSIGRARQLLRGRVVRSATFEVTRQRLANDRALLDAAERTARETAEEIRLRLATYFVSDGAARAHLSPELEQEEEFPLEDVPEDLDLDF